MALLFMIWEIIATEFDFLRKNGSNDTFVCAIGGFSCLEAWYAARDVLSVAHKSSSSGPTTYTLAYGPPSDLAFHL